MKTILLALAVVMAGVLSLHAQKKNPKRPKRNVTFEYRFDDDLKQTADSKKRQALWFRDAKFGAFIHFGVYCSHAQDWDEPDAPYLNKRAKLRDIHPDLPADFEQDMDRYIRKKSLPQVEELVKNYELDLIWFDTPVGMNMERAKLFSEMVRKHRPNWLINSRLIHSGKGKIEPQYLPLYDYVSIGDKEVPTKKLPLYVESPDSVSSSFGYKTKGDYEIGRGVIAVILKQAGLEPAPERERKGTWAEFLGT